LDELRPCILEAVPDEKARGSSARVVVWYVQGEAAHLLVQAGRKWTLAGVVCSF
jgi:hypothetical protein